ncbi:MAG: helix-turn-helix transcriptional regulator [Candidatus Cloacimonetes bacterium]|nr:helix-turn-helix transcriptional regulator [Candidatus Cloacimonadota bacterium]
MSGLGSYLKSVREGRNISIDEISQKTRINKRIIEEIESENYRYLNENGYPLVFILTYARELGADTARVEDDIDKMLNRKSKTVSKTKKKREKKILISTKTISIVFVLVLSVALYFIVYSLYKNNSLNFSWDVFSSLFKKTKTEKHSTKSVPSLRDSVNLRIATMSQPEIDTEKFIIYEECLRDSNDYVNEIIFNNRKSSLNSEINPDLNPSGLMP